MKKIEGIIPRNSIAPFLLFTILFLIFLSFQLPIDQIALASTESLQKDSSKDSTSPVEYVEVKTIPLYEILKTKEKWEVKAFQANVEDLGYKEIPARICFCTDSCRQCFEAKTDSDETLYNFQYVKKLSLEPLFKNKEPLNANLFITEYHYEGGSGSLNYLTLWVYKRETKEFVNIVPKVLFTEQGEYRLFSKEKGVEGILVIADYVWGDGETHFSQHRYKIEIYKFVNNSKSFVLYKEYTTKSKYTSLDETDEINVIMPELKKIKKLIK
jgi:hypothetical protein